ncbi:MAG: ABC transporter permease [Bacteroidia bacterium]|nr:ABC transporter permease [Bacteroidia bacterium]
MALAEAPARKNIRCANFFRTFVVITSPNLLHPLNFEYFFARRITFKTHRKASGLMVRLSIISMALAVATMEIALSFVQGFETEIQKKVAGFGAHIQIGHFMRETDTEVIPMSTFEPTLDSVRRLPMVVSVSPYVERWAVLKAETGWDGVLLRGVGAEQDWSFFTTVLKEGRLPAYLPADTSASREVLISRKLARRLRLQVGDKTRLLFLPQPIRRRPAEVVGIYETGMEEFDNSIVICDMRLLQQIWRWKPHEVAGFRVYLRSMEDIPEAQPAINDALLYSAGADAITDLYPEIFDWLRLQHQNVWVILILMVVVAVINMTTVVLVLIIERIRTIGILKSMGLPAYRVRRMFVWYAFFLILAGVIAGNLLGLGLLAAQDTWGWLRVNQEDYFIETVPVAWVWGRFVLINAGVIIICTACMVIPTLVADRITAIRAIRFE